MNGVFLLVSVYVVAGVTSCYRFLRHDHNTNTKALSVFSSVIFPIFWGADLSRKRSTSFVSVNMQYCGCVCSACVPGTLFTFHIPAIHFISTVESTEQDNRRRFVFFYLNVLNRSQLPSHSWKDQLLISFSVCAMTSSSEGSEAPVVVLVWSIFVCFNPDL